MHIIPVLDIKDGLTVRARMGNRDAYQPIETPLSPTANVLDVADGLCALYPFPAFYVADLDAIQHRASAETALHRVKPLLAKADIWLDAGFCEPQQLEHALAVGGIWPILGSESQADASVLDRFRDNPRLILSLDFRGDAFLGPSSILENTGNWPSRIIVMTLRRIGADSGPDFDRLTEIKRRADGRAVIAAGGIRGLQDLERLEAAGIAAALVATSLHNGALTSEAIAALMKTQRRD